MSFLSAIVDRKLRFTGIFSGYGHNAAYDSAIARIKTQKTHLSRHREDENAAEDRMPEAGEAEMASSYVRAGHRLNLLAGSLAIIHIFALLCGSFIWSIMMRIIKRLQPVSIVLFVALIAFLVGFVAFSEKVSQMPVPVLERSADAIVVLTGGQSRIQAGLDLLKDKRGRRLLISGVHPSTNEQMLQRATKTDSSLFDCCIDLDRSALNTVGNATESERWIRGNGYQRVIIVTNNYHMPRSILEMSSRMKDVEFIPYPVVNGDKREHSWIAEGDALRVLFTEYVKYLGAAIRQGGTLIFSNV